MNREPIAFIPYLFLAAFVFAGWMWHAGDQRAVVSLPPAQGVKQVTVGGPFALIDQHSKPVTDRDFHGKYMLVFFGFTYCPDVCPTTLAVITAALDKLGAKADRVAPLFITIDPERDTPEELRNYLDAFGSRFYGLTGSPEAVAEAAKAYRVYYKKRPMEGGTYTMDHTSIIYLMDAEGKFVTNYSLEQGPDAIAADMEKRIRDAT